MNDQAHHYRCDERAFAFDLTNFIKLQLGRAIGDPDVQLAASIAASGVVPVLFARLVPDHEKLWSDLNLVLDPYLDSADGHDLASLAKLPRDEFLTKAKRLLDNIDQAQRLLLNSGDAGPAQDQCPSHRCETGITMVVLGVSQNECGTI